MKLIEWLKEPQTRDIGDPDDPATTLLHTEIVQRKRVLRHSYASSDSIFVERWSDAPTTCAVIFLSGCQGDGICFDSVE